MHDPRRTASAVLALWLGLAGAACASSAATAAPDARPPQAARAAEPRPKAVTRMVQWIIASDDNGGLPFVLVDKAAAKVFVFGADGQLHGAAPALVGSARGDDATPATGDREMSAIPPGERTTPAGRFVASFGPTAGGRRVLWVDYATAIALHPVVTGNPKERRLQRLKSPTPRDNHISHGCINVPAAFYAKVVRPSLKGSSGIVYILPEQKRLEEVFPAFREAATTAAAGDPSAARDPQSATPPQPAAPPRSARIDAALGK